MRLQLPQFLFVKLFAPQDTSDQRMYSVKHGNVLITKRDQTFVFTKVGRRIFGERSLSLVDFGHGMVGERFMRHVPRLRTGTHENETANPCAN